MIVYGYENDCFTLKRRSYGEWDYFCPNKGIMNYLGIQGVSNYVDDNTDPDQRDLE